MSVTKRNLPLVWVAAACFILFLTFYYVPQLSSSNDSGAASHRLNRVEAEQAATTFVRERIGETAELRAFAVYAAEREAYGYLDRDGDLQRVFDHFGEQLPLEAYRVEVIETDTGRQHFVDINPYSGVPSEWDLELTGAPLSKQLLERAALTALQKQGLASYRPTLATTDESRGEVTYSLHDTSLQGASVYVTVRADASGTGAFLVRWSVPESYAAVVAKQELWSSILGFLGLTLSIGLQLSALIYMILHIRDARLGRGMLMGLSYILFYGAVHFTMYPAFIGSAADLIDGGDYLRALDGETGSAASLMFTSNLFVLFFGIGLYFSSVAGDLLSRKQQWRVWSTWSQPGYGQEVMDSVRKGYLFAFVLLGFQTVIFAAAETGMGTWYTVDAYMSPYNLLSPYLMPLLAWCAAFSEEAVYRLWAIPALRKLFRFTFPAVLISSMIWALGHVQYPIYPFYTRFIEVTILGLLFAYIFLKHGFLTAVFAHAVTDTVWMGLAVTAAHPTVASWSIFLLYMAAPALIGWSVRLAHRNRR